MIELSSTKASFKRVSKSIYSVCFECASVQEKVIHDKFKSFLDLIDYRYQYESRCCYEGRSYIEPDFLIYDSNSKVTLIEFKKRGVNLHGSSIINQVTKYSKRLYSHRYKMSGKCILTDGLTYDFYHIDENGFKSLKPYKSYKVSNPEDLIKLSEEFLLMDAVSDKISEEKINAIVEAGTFLIKGDNYLTETIISGKKCFVKLSSVTLEVVVAYKLPYFRTRILLEDDPVFIKATELLNSNF